MFSVLNSVRKLEKGRRVTTLVCVCNLIPRPHVWKVSFLLHMYKGNLCWLLCSPYVVNSWNLYDITTFNFCHEYTSASLRHSGFVHEYTSMLLLGIQVSYMQDTLLLLSCRHPGFVHAGYTYMHHVNTRCIAFLTTMCMHLLASFCCVWVLSICSSTAVSSSRPHSGTASSVKHRSSADRNQHMNISIPE